MIDSFLIGFTVVLKIAAFFMAAVFCVYGFMYLVSKLWWNWKAGNSFLSFIGLVLILILLVAGLSGFGTYLYELLTR